MGVFTKLSRLLFIAAMTLVLAACGRGFTKKTSVVGPDALPSPQPVINSCVTPISGTLTRLSAGGNDVAPGTTVQWQLNLSGGCSTQYSLDRGQTLISNPYIYPKTYTQQSTGQREQMTITAVYASGSVNPLAQVIISDPFNVTAPPAVAALSCNVLYPVAAPTVPVDLNGNITSTPLPAYNFGVQLLRNNVAVAGRIVDVQALGNAGLPFALPTGYLPTPDTGNTMPVQLPVMFSKAGTQVLGITVSTVNPAQTGVCVLVFNIMGQLPPPPVVRTFAAVPTSVVEGASTIFSWTTGGTISACKLYGSIRGYSAELPLNGSLEVPIYQTETFRLSCREVDSDPITITAIPRPDNIDVNLVAGNRDPNMASMSGQRVSFAPLNSAGGTDYGQFFYGGVEIESIARQELGIATTRCEQIKIQGGAAAANNSFGNYGNNYYNGDKMRPLGTVGVYAFAHGNGTTQVTAHTNFRNITLRATYTGTDPNGIQSPFILSNGFKVFLGYRTFQGRNSDGAVIALVPGEYVTSFSNSVSPASGAGVATGIWKAVCR